MVDAIVKGGVTIISVYMADSEGLSERNMLVLQEAAALVRRPRRAERAPRPRPREGNSAACSGLSRPLELHVGDERQRGLHVD